MTKIPTIDAATHGLAGALAKNAEAADAVQEVADELSVVHAVLSKEVANVGDGDAATAVERTAALEQKLTETAEKMAEVNQALAEQQASLKHLSNAQ
jgi:hypothetical protein